MKKTRLRSVGWRTRVAWLLPLILIVAVSLALARPARRPVVRPPAANGEGLQMRLSEGSPEAAGRESGPPRVAVSPLASDVVTRLFASLPKLVPATDDQVPFKMRAKTLPRPRPGKTVNEPFPGPTPPPGGPPRASDGTLSVLRFAPQGNVPLVPQLSVTFSQPMVPVTSLEELASQDVPVKLTPQPAGKWRWIGTKTLLFEPADQRFPMATTYTAVVPAGTKDAAGHALAAETRFTFTTPPPQVESSTPTGGPVGRTPVMVLVFDQKVDPAAVLRTVKTSPAATLSLATPEEIKADAAAASVYDAARPGRAVAFKAAAPFPTATSVTVTVDAGTPSAEGPLLTDKAQSTSFRTYGPMVVEDYGCGYGNECPPLTPWRVRFSNPVDMASFQPSMVKVSPPLPGMKVDVGGAYMSIGGRSKGRTTYTVTLDPSLKDVFGQTLSDPKPMAFKVGSARPALAGPNGAFILADPFAAPGYTVFSINHPQLRVRTYAVTAADWPRFAAFMQRVNDEKYPTPPGTLVENKLVETRGQPDELTETTIDLRPSLKSGLGHVIVIVEPPVQPKERWQRRYLQAWVESTHIGLDAAVDGRIMAASATSLSDGQPLDGVQLSISGSSAQTTTDKLGLGVLDLPQKGAEHRVLVAKRGDDVALLPESKYWWSSSDAWTKRSRIDALRWFVFDDRGIYKPNETVHFKGWMRIVQAGPKGDLTGLNGSVKSVHYTVSDSRGNEVAKGDVAVNALGGFDGAFKLPDNLNLGSATLHLSAATTGGLDGTSTQHGFQVEEFRRPEFEVAASAPAGPYFIGSHAMVTTEAKYYAGGPLPNAQVTWQVTSSPGYFSPPGHPEFTFGTWVPWFWWGDSPSSGASSVSMASRTDAAGRHVLRIDFDGVRPPQASSVKAEATVMDVNRQAWSASATMLVHPASEYVGLRRKKLFVNPGETVEVDAIVADIDGKVVPSSTVKLHAVLLDYTWKDGRWQTVESHPEDVTLTSGATPVTAVLHPKEGGTWRVRATITDRSGRPNQSEMMFWVTGGKQPPEREVTAERLLLVPDRKSYQPGDVAHVLVQAPFPGGHGVYSLARSGLIETRTFDCKGTSATLDIPIDPSYPPNVDLSVEVTGASERQTDDGKADPRLPKRTAFALGSLTLDVPPLARKLTVRATPRDKAVKPGARTSIDVTVLDAAGKPVSGGEAAVVVVDESVLALTGYKLDDPMVVFYALRGSETSEYHSRSDMVLANPAGLGDASPQAQRVMNEAAPTTGTFAPGAAPPPAPMVRAAPKMDKKAADMPSEPQGPQIQLRTNFDPLACFSPAVPLDANGHATVNVKVPDNLTRYRVMVVAVNGGNRFGSAESVLTARLPLMVRPSAPRFLNFGDQFSLPIVLQNQTEHPMKVQVAARATNVKLKDAGYGLTIPANDRVEVLFPAATELAGTARFQVVARSEAGGDAAEFSLPVYTPATTEAFATYGVLDGNGAMSQPVKAPNNIFPQFGGLEIEVSSTALQALTDAVLYLVRYPFECAEQVSSRVIGISALRDVLTAFKAKGLPDPKTLSATVALDVEKLKTMQNDDGGFAFWRRGDTSWPYISVHVTNALVRAREKGYMVTPPMLERAKSYLRDVESHIPSWYPESCRNAIIAYALNVRWRMGDRDVARARKLVATALPAATGNTPAKERLSVEAVAWLLPVLDLTAPGGKVDASSAPQVAQLKRYLDNRVTETAGAASFATGYEDGQYLLLATSRRADAIVLESLILTDPKNDLIPKIVKGLLGHRSAGRWDNTQENVFVLLALDRYFNTYEKATPDFVARIWLGADYAGEQAFKGRSTNRFAFNIPMATVVQPPDTKDLLIDKQGAGRLYYRIGMQYAPRDLNLKPLEAGFTVQRRYEPVDDKSDVVRNADGSYTIKAGARVKVRVTMVAQARRVHVALVDPLPAGLEALNPALAVQGALPQDNDARRPGNPYWYWYRPWYEHQNLRDERAEAFTSLLWEGVYDYTYFCRATTPGQFVVPPPKAEEMYSPEVFGRGATDRVTVK